MPLPITYGHGDENSNQLHWQMTSLNLVASIKLSNSLISVLFLLHTGSGLVINNTCKTSLRDCCSCIVPGDLWKNPLLPFVFGTQNVWGVYVIYGGGEVRQDYVIFCFAEGSVEMIFSFFLAPGLKCILSFFFLLLRLIEKKTI